jgi:hypothetical protein
MKLVTACYAHSGFCQCIGEGSMQHAIGGGIWFSRADVAGSHCPLSASALLRKALQRDLDVGPASAQRTAGTCQVGGSGSSGGDSLLQLQAWAILLAQRCGDGCWQVSAWYA